MAQGCIIFVEIGQCVKVHKPDNATNAETDEVASKSSNACHLMDNNFSALYAKRGSITDDKN